MVSLLRHRYATPVGRVTVRRRERPTPRTMLVKQRQIRHREDKKFLVFFFVNAHATVLIRFHSHRKLLSKHIQKHNILHTILS